MKGSYVLLIEVSRPFETDVGKLGRLDFRPGFYAYAGSALGGLERRVQRHLTSKKKLFWHVDYLLQKSEVAEVFRIESSERLECRIARELSKRLDSVPGFGCSDCKCGSHLFHSPDEQLIKKYIIDALRGFEK